MKRIASGIKRLWLIASCTHVNQCLAMVFEDTTELRICRSCGLVIKFADEGTIRNNPHLEWTKVAGIPN
jgi:hypothetical protein